MGYFDGYHIFRDPIHGYIKVYDIERDIINSLAFQRLRRIKQLGPTNLVYHGADHTRFAHSLGVMELATRVFETIILKDKQEHLIPWQSDEERTNKKILLRLAALLHDVGHAPLSHATESQLFPKGLDHRSYSKKVIMEDTEIKEVLDKVENDYGVTSDSICNLIIREDSDEILQPILDGPLDADKMDYLWRDSFYTGVHYGKFDLERILNTLTVVVDKVIDAPSLGIEEGGVYTAEALMLARYYMFLQVYFHPVRRIYDLHYSSFIRGMLNKYGGVYPETLTEYLRFDDSVVIAELEEEYYSKGENFKFARIIFERKHHELIHETNDFASPAEEKLFFNRKKDIEQKFPDVELLADPTKDAPNKFKKDPFYVKVRNPKTSSIADKYEIINEKSNLIEKLNDEIHKFRLYCPRENVNEVKEFYKTLNFKP